MTTTNGEVSISSSLSSSTSSINSRKLGLGLSATWSGKAPSTPRPDRASTIFQSVEKGLRECIGLTLSDICMLKVSIEEGVSISSAQQYKAAERYLKRLEFQLAKVEELKDQYDVHLKMRDGVRSMAQAYVLSRGKDRETALSSVRSGFKECTDSLCAIESELESMMGTFWLEMKGIQGYARLCPGDVFEVTIKHGENQKWKTKGKILKNGDQTWDSHQVCFKALLGDVFAIKAVEVRGLGKNVTLGSKFCETKDLFSAHPQLMTISLNAVGTLKLNLVVTWNPLHCVSGNSGRGLRKSYHSASSTSLLGIGSSRTLPAILPTSPRMHNRKYIGTLPGDRIAEIVDAEYYHHRHPGEDEGSNKIRSQTEPPTTVSTSSGSTGSSLHLTGTSGFGSGSGSSYCGSSSIPNSALTSPETENAPSLQVVKRRSMSATNICPKHGKNRLSNHEASSKSEKLTVEVSVHKNPSQETVGSNKEFSTIEEDEVDYSSSSLYKKRTGTEKYGLLSAESAANLYFNIGDTLIHLLTSLEDIQGQYSELHLLQHQVLELFNVLKQLRKLREVRYEKSEKGRNQQKRHLRHNSASSEISMSVESALQCFDFLNNAITDSESESSPVHQQNGKSNQSPIKRLPTSSEARNGIQTLPRADKGDSSGLVSSPIAENKRNLIYSSNPNFSPGNCSSTTPSPIGSPHPLSTGSEQLDIALMSHLTYCQRLMENLGSFGPLRNRELKSLEKLQAQSYAMKSLLRLCTNLCQYLQARREAKEDEARRNSIENEYQMQLEKEINYLKSDQRIQKLWDIVSYCASGKCEDTGTLLVCVTSGQFAQSLEAYIKAFATSINGNLNTNLAFSKVAKLITSRVIDAAKFESDCIVTIFQAVIFFSQENASLEHIFKTYAEEAFLLDCLLSGDAIQIKQCLNRFKKTLPPKEPLFSVALLLLDNDPLIVRIAETYLLESSKVKSLRTGLISQFLEGLEADLAAIRQASCLGLMLLSATETMEQLLYISYADTSSAVREQAKATLFSFGDSGRKLYEESQLFANGFQGLSVK